MDFAQIYIAIHEKVLFQPVEIQKKHIGRLLRTGLLETEETAKSKKKQFNFPELISEKNDLVDLPINQPNFHEAGNDTAPLDSVHAQPGYIISQCCKNCVK